MERVRGFFRPGGSRAVAALIRARTAGFQPRSRVSTEPTPARSGLRALPYSLLFYCEGLEEKFLERGAPAPLSVRLIDDFRVVQSVA